MMDRSDYIASAREKIARYGRYIQTVFGSDRSPPFAYTVGNHSKGLPELLIVGIGPKTGGGLLNDLSDLMLSRGRAFEDGERPDLGMPIRCAVIEASDKVKQEFTILVDDVLEVSSADYRVMQVIIPDEKGRLPWEPECSKPFRGLPVFRKNPLH